ncbi:MAG: 6-bladed beta-propeller [Pseudomonadota bacterium]
MEERPNRIGAVQASRRWCGVLVCVAMALLAGCAAAPQRPDTGELVWPAPPEAPRIRYVAEYHSQNDLGSGPGFKELLLGDNKVVPALEKPYGVTVSADGQRIYVADTKLRSVMVFDLQAKTLRPFRTDAQSRVVSPIEVRLDSKGNLYVTDSVHARLNVYSPQGKTLLSLGKAENLQRPTGLAIDEARGRIYVADTKAHRIVVYGMDGRFITSFGERGSEPGQFNFPVNLTVDKDGNLYVVDSGNFRVQILAGDGSPLRNFGRAGDAFGSMGRPKGIALDSEGHVYLADAAFNNFQIFDVNGNIMLFVGSLGREPGRFWIPAGMYMSATDRLYVVDSVNARVQVFQYLGSAQSGGSTSGTTAR